MEIVGDYEFSTKDVLGYGSFAIVFKGRQRQFPEQAVAVKCIIKKKINKSEFLISKEIKILKEVSGLHHENVVQLMDCKETTEYMYLVMECCNGGDLDAYLKDKKRLSEDTIAHFLKQIAAAMRAINAMGIVHRDMKPQNILLCFPPGVKNPPPAKIRLKIADFGFARFLGDGIMAETFCGTPIYMAPEVYMSLEYDGKADLWSIGTIVFQCLIGYPPFQAQTPPQLKQFYEKTLEVKPNIPSGTSPELKDLLLKLLKRNAKDRIGFDEFFMHPFLQAHHSATSSPVPVPGRCASFSSVSPVSSKEPSCSFFAGKMNCSPSPPAVDALKVKDSYHSSVILFHSTGLDHKTRSSISPPKSPKSICKNKELREPSCQVTATDSPKDVAGFLKSDTEGEASSSSLTEDYDMIPEAFGLQFYGEDKTPKMSRDRAGTVSGNTTTGTVSPTFGAVLGRKESLSKLISRPSSLQVICTARTPRSSPPIPVPGQVAAYQRMLSNSPGSQMQLVNAMDSNSSIQRDVERKESSLPQQGSSVKINVGDLSPPVQFTIGTPPGNSTTPGSWQRGSSTNIAKTRGTTPRSHLRRSGSVPGHLALLQPPGLGVLPTIIDTPTKAPTIIHYPPNLSDLRSGMTNHTMYLRHHPYTVPENLHALQFIGNETMVPIAGFGRNHEHINSGSNDVTKRCAGYMRQTTTALSPPHTLTFTQSPPNMDGGYVRQITAAMSPPHTLMFTQSPPNMDGGYVRQITAAMSPRHTLMYTQSPPNMEGGYARQMTVAVLPPHTLRYTQSPPNMEGPINLVAPELSEETLLDEQHNAIMAKLNFTLDLVQCILDVAKSRAAPLSSFSKSVSCTKGEGLQEQVTKLTECQRRLEQLILYVRVLYLSSSALQLAQDEIRSGRLLISSSVKSVVKQINDHYRNYVMVSRQLQQKLGSALLTVLYPHIVIATADQLIYNYAIEMCQTAALDELFDNPCDCFHKYQTAQILLHSLVQQTRDSNIKESLNKYKGAVERRLLTIQSTFNPTTYLPN